MNLQDFVNQWNGKQNDFDHNGDPECVDLVKNWVSLNNKPSVVGNGKDWAGAFNWVPYRASLSPQPGDIVVWGTSVGPFGHVAIAMIGIGDKFQSFDQNWRLDQTCHIENHNYRGVLGWNQFNPKENIVSIEDEARIKVDMVFESFLGMPTDSTKYAQLIVDTVTANPGNYESKIDAESRTKDLVISDHRDRFNQLNAHILGG